MTTTTITAIKICIHKKQLQKSNYIQRIKANALYKCHVTSPNLYFLKAYLRCLTFSVNTNIVIIFIIMEFVDMIYPC